MSNGWLAGQVAKTITGKKRSRKFYNVFLIIVLTVLTISFLYIAIFQILSDYTTYESEQIFIDYSDGYLQTNSDSFKIADDKSQEIKIRQLLLRAEKGDNIRLKISSISGELIEIKYSGKVVYKVITTDIRAVISFFILLCFGYGLVIFMLIVVNAKKPRKRIDKLQKKAILRFYE